MANANMKEAGEESHKMTSDQGRSLSSDKGTGAADVDAILEQLGSRGRYQMTQLTLHLIASFANTIVVFAVVFVGYQPDFQCSQVDNVTQLEDYFPDDVTNFTLHDVTYGQCSIDVTVNSSGTSSTHFSLPCIAGVNFSMPSYTSFLTEWSLVCDKTGLTELTQTGFFAGQALGSLVFCNLTDRYGRRNVYLICALGSMVSCLSVSFVNIYELLLFCRTASGFFEGGMENSAYMLLVELFPQKRRGITSLLDSNLWSLGNIFLATVAYCMQGVSWRYLNLAVSSVLAYSLLLPWGLALGAMRIGKLLLFAQSLRNYLHLPPQVQGKPRFLDESLRWLVAVGKLEEAERIVKKACRLNGKDPEKILPLLHSCSSRRSNPTTPINYEMDVSTTTNFPLLLNNSKDEDSSFLRQTKETSEYADKNSSVRLNSETSECGDVNDIRLNSDTSEYEDRNSRKRLNSETSEYGDKKTVYQKNYNGCCEDEIKMEILDKRVGNGLMGDLRFGDDDDDYDVDNEEQSCKERLQESQNKPSTPVQYNALDLFRHRAVLVPFLVCVFIWMTNNLFFYAVMLGSASLSGNRFLNFGALAALQIPTTFVMFFLLPRFNRRKLGFVFGLSEGLFLLLSVTLMALGGDDETILTLATVAQYAGMVCLNASFIIYFVYYMEVYPTSLRSVGTGLTAAAIQLADMAAPFLLVWRRKTPWAPGVLVGCMCCLASASIWLLPETRHRKLPDTIEEIQAWKMDKRTSSA